MSKFREVMVIGKRAGFECNELFQIHEVVHLMQQAYESGYLGQQKEAFGKPLEEKTEQIVALLTKAFNSQMMGEEMEGMEETK